MPWRKILLLAVLGTLVALYLGLDLGRYLNLEFVKSQQQAITAFQQAQPLAAAGIYFGLYLLVTAVSLPGAALLTLIGGAIFGLGWGTLLVSFASSLGATLAFLSARYVLRDWVAGHFGPRLKAIDAGVHREGVFYLFSLRLVPVIPFFIINLAFGLTAMRTLSFYWVSQVGMFPATLVYVNAGTQLARLESLGGILSPQLLGSLILLGLFPLLAKRLLDAARARRVYAGWTRPRRFDRNLLVIGAGSAGLVTAYIAAAVKAKVTLIEQGPMGGDCLNTGCVPSKALLRGAKFLAQVRRAEEFGCRPVNVEVDFAEVMARVRRVVDQVAPHDSVERYTGLGVEVLRGRARLISPWEVEVTAADGSIRRLSARALVIATGARPWVPPIPGLDQVPYVTSDSLWELRELPDRLLVLGGGPIGAELTQAFARLGAQVTLVEMAPRLLIREDPEVSDLVEAKFRAEGVRVLVNHRAEQFLVENGEYFLVAGHGDVQTRIPFDQVLVAVGRIANLQGFGLEELGVVTSRALDTNEFLQTNFPNILAAGDVVGPYQFTHAASHQAWYAAVNALFDPFKKFKVDYRIMPWCTFLDPEVARVGLNEQEARAQGIPFEVTRFDLEDLDRAIADGTTQGFVKVLTVPGKDRILGVTLVGEHAGDLIAEYVLAMKQGIGLNKILGTIHIYPTLAEANKYVAGAWKRAHAPQGLLAWVERFHQWRRGAQ